MDKVLQEQMAEKGVETIARQYVETVNNQPNGNGQNRHKLYGDSANMLGLMWLTFGRDIADKAIDLVFAEKRNS